MKNALILGGVAVLLFSVSAALSLWLNQSRQDAEKADKDKDAKVAPKSSEPAKDKEPPAVDPKRVPPAPLPNLGSPDAGVLDQQAKLERKALQISMVLADLQAQREATDALYRQVATEFKNAPKAAAPDPDAARIQKEREEAQRNEQAQIRKLAAVYDQMTPEGAAQILRQIAESGPGKMEQAAQIIVLMKERNSARLFEALGDPALAAQLMDKVRQLKAQGAAQGTPPTAPAPAPAGSPPFAGGVRPAGSP